MKIRILLLAGLAACAPSAGPAFVSANNASAELIGEGVLSTAANEYNPSLTPDGRMMVFARSEPDFQAAKILVSHLRGGGWSAPEPVPFADARYVDSDPTLSPDGRTLYFISDRPVAGRDTARRDLDLWRVARRGGEWGAPEHLGAEVNSAAQELGPTWHDGALYFASSRGGGRGGLDVYRAAESGGRFGAARPVEWNTEMNESDPEFSRDGSLVLFWAIRPGGAGEADVYARRRTATGWGEPRALRGAANSAGFDFTPSFSADGRWLYFASMRADSASGSPVMNGESNLYRIPAAAVLPAD